MLNKILGEERVIVSPIAGTTRDAIDTELTVDGQKFILIDTAGIRRKGKTIEMAEKLSVIMARKSLERADVAVMIIDATEGVTSLDANIAGYAVESGCSVIIAVNKWDALEEKETNTIYRFEDNLRQKMKFLDWAPMITISALTGQRVDKNSAAGRRANEARNLRIPTSKLNKFFEQKISQPKGGSNAFVWQRRIFASQNAVYYARRNCARRCLFYLLPAASKAGLHFSYLRYIENRLRDEFEFFATPLRLKEKHKVRKKADD